MKKWKIFFIITLIANFFWSCEKDDICETGTPTTPRLIIEFYDNDNITVKKNVENLVIGSDSEVEVLKFNGVSKIELPLKTNASVTSYFFRLTTATTIPTLVNEDKVTLNYSKKDSYISRACGYKTVFTLNGNDGFDRSTDLDNWIKNSTVQQPNILNENETHVKIFF